MAATPVWRLRRPRDFDLLPDSLAAVTGLLPA
jgi:hypothetical protein